MQEEPKATNSSGAVLKRGAYQVEDFDKMRAELFELKKKWETNKAESIQMTDTKQPSVPIICPVCEIEGYAVDECPQLPVMKETMMIYHQQNSWKNKQYDPNQQFKQ